MGNTFSDGEAIYQKKQAGRVAAARRPVLEKLEVVAKLRAFEQELEPIRAANKALRASQGVKIRIKTA